MGSEHGVRPNDELSCMEEFSSPEDFVDLTRVTVRSATGMRGPAYSLDRTADEIRLRPRQFSSIPVCVESCLTCMHGTIRKTCMDSCAYALDLGGM